MLLLAVGGDGVGGVQIDVSGAVIAALALVVVALLGLAGAIYSARTSRGAQDKSTEVEGRRLKLEEQQQRHSELRDYTDRVERELKEARDALNRGRIENDRRQDGQAARCAAALSSAMDTVHLLQQVVRDEVAAAAADTAIDDALGHTTTDHPEEPS